MWIESGHPARSLKRYPPLFRHLINFEYSYFFEHLVSTEDVSLFTVGYCKPSCSQLTLRAGSWCGRSEPIRIADEQYLLYVAADPTSDRSLTPGSFRRMRFRSHENPSPSVPRTTASLTPCFSPMTNRSHRWYPTRKPSATASIYLSYRVHRHGFRNPIERISCEVRRETSLFSNCFTHIDLSTAEAGCKPTPSGGTVLESPRPERTHAAGYDGH